MLETKKKGLCRYFVIQGAILLIENVRMKVKQPTKKKKKNLRKTHETFFFYFFFVWYGGSANPLAYKIS